MLGCIGIVCTGYINGIADYFNLQGKIPALLLICSIAVAIAVQWLENRERLNLYTFGLLTLLGAFFFQSFMWSLVSFSIIPGAMVMAGFPVLITSFHGHLYQSTLRYPFLAVVSLTAVLTAVAFNHDRGHLIIIIVTAPLALGTHLLLGHFSKQDSQIRKEREQMRAAIDAQILRERTHDLNRINEILTELRGTNHDAGNTLSGIMLNVPLFQKIARDPELSKSKLEKAAKIANILDQNLQKLNDLLSSSRDSLRSHTKDNISISPHKIITETLESFQNQFPYITFIYTCSELFNQLTLSFYGGSTSFSRILNNIILNACQGNGLTGATVIEVIPSIDIPSQIMTITVADNGPGFGSSHLLTPIQLFKTSKSSGSGLGLYTSQQLLKANNAEMTIRNRENETGAIVDLIIPIERHG